MGRESLGTLPNLLSLSRIGMAAIFPLLDGGDERLLLVAAAGATDFLDGYLARTRGATSKLGALIDPVSDRCFMLVAVLVLWAEGTLSLPQLLLLALRDICVAAAFFTTRGIVSLKRFSFAARPLGKVVTVLQLATLGIAYLLPHWLDAAAVIIAAISVVAVADYTVALVRGRSPA